MTKEDIIRMAREAGFTQRLNNADEWFMWTHEIERFAALVAAAAIKEAPDYKMGYADGMAAEREACAKTCERIWPSKNRSGHEWTDGFADGTCDCADAIRARGQE